MSDAHPGGSKYTIQTGEGYCGSFAVNDTGELRAQVGRSVIREMGAEPGDAIGIHDHEHGILILAPPGDCDLIKKLKVVPNGSITLSKRVLLDKIGASDGDRIYCYDRNGGIVVVPNHSDPYVDGDSA